MIAIFKKELWSYFGNWSAWIIIAAFSLIATLFLFFFDNDSNIFEIGMASLQSYFVLVPWLLMFIIPALSMKTFAEEQQTGTLNWLFSQPLKVSDLVLGKFLSVFILVASSGSDFQREQPFLGHPLSIKYRNRIDALRQHVRRHS